MGNDILKRVQTLQRYMRALKDGDIETVATLLKDAEQDRALENMLLEVNASYQYEDCAPVQQNDIMQAQNLMNTIAHKKMRRKDIMHYPLSHTEDASVQTATVVTTQKPPSADPAGTERNELMPVFSAKAAAKRKWYRSLKKGIAALAAAILIFFILLQSNGVLASQISAFLFHQTKPVIIDLPVDAKPYVSFSNLGSFSAKTGFFTHGSSIPKHYATKAEVERVIDFPLLLPAQLPADLQGANPDFSVVEGGYETFTFSAAQTRTYLEKNGYGNISIPANLDGATFRMGIANHVQISYEKGAHDLLLTEASSYNIQATGNASMKNLEDFMLLLPNLSPVVKQEYQQNNGDMLAPFPTGTQITPITVHHIAGFLLNGKTRVPWLIWQENGIQYQLSAEGIPANQALAMANSLHS